MVKSILFYIKVWISLIIFTSNFLDNQVKGNDFYDSFIFDSDYCDKELKVIKTIYTKYNCVSFVSDQSNNIVIVKQSKDPALITLLHFICERLGTYVAEVNDIPANKVKIIPAGRAVPGKMYKHLPATVHTVVPGKPINCLFDFPEKFIRLKEGFTRSIIRNMSLHSFFPVIVALDTFINNNDRGTTNFFYDKESNRFWLIDFHSSFRGKLGIEIGNYIETLLENEDCHFSDQELNGLIIYRDMLQNLISKHSPKELIKTFYIFADQAGVKIGSALYSNKVAKKIQKFEKNIFQNYSYTKRLVSLLNKLIDQEKNKFVQQFRRTDKNKINRY